MVKLKGIYMSSYPIKTELSDDYAQSANTLFHFVSKVDYLKYILLNKAIVPRYCIEDIDYLSLENNNKIIDKIAVLQKCFCDIPIHKITTNCFLRGSGKNFDTLSSYEKRRAEQSNTHTDFYGRYAIAFSKEWGESNNFQPVQYVNPQSHFTHSFINSFNSAIKLDDLPDEISDDINQKLAFIKPLRGKMQRQFHRDSSEITIEFIKNFHDEQEWRYVPDAIDLEKLSLPVIIANSNLVDQLYLKEVNKGLEDNKYNTIWLKYNYQDIRYIIVPNAESRMDIIKTIFDLDDTQFENAISTDVQKQLLVSKILVLEEIRRDW